MPRTSPKLDAACRILEKDILPQHKENEFLPSITVMAKRYPHISSFTWNRAYRKYKPYLNQSRGYSGCNGTWLAKKPKDGVYRKLESTSEQPPANAKQPLLKDALTNTEALELLLLLASGDYEMPVEQVIEVLQRIKAFAPDFVFPVNLVALQQKYRRFNNAKF